MAVATGAIALPVLPSDALAAPQSSAAAERSRRGRGRGRGLVVAASVAVLVAVALGAMRLLGVEWFVVTTPSMGTAVPVGSLAIDAPVDARSLAAGDVITFTPPGSAQQVHTHRIAGIGPRGITTRGDANAAPDPWTLPIDRIRGEVVGVVPGLGWLLRALPILLVGGLVTWGVAMVLRRRDLRVAAIVLGASVSVSAVSLVLRPLVNAVLLTAASTGRGSVATVVSTGLLPVRISASSGAHVDLVNGQVGVLRAYGSGGRIDLAVALHLPPAGWAVVAAACAVPLFVPFVFAAAGRRR